MLININAQSKYAPICFQIKDSIVADNKVIASEFNNFFNSIATKFDSRFMLGMLYLLLHIYFLVISTLFDAIASLSRTP